MYLFVIIGLVMALGSLDFWGGDPPPDAGPAIGGAAAVAAAVFLAGLGLGGYILWRRADLAADEQRFLRKVRLLARAYRLLVLAAYAFILAGLGWTPLAAHWTAGAGECAAAAAAVAPLIVLAALAWTAVYWADRTLRAAMWQHAGVVAAAGQWTLPRYLEFMFRQYLLVLLVPLLVLLAVRDGMSYAFGGAEAEGPASLLFLAVTLGALLLAGPWVRLCWRTEPLPEGELRRRLEALAERAGVRVGRILVWRTNLTIANGCMVGLVGPLRYILITDALLLAMSQRPEEAEAVFAHEVGHVKHRHTLFFAALALGGIAAALLAGEAAAAWTESFWTANAAAGAAAIAWWWFGFGYVSRRCELEADLYAVRATECPASCSPPDAGARPRDSDADGDAGALAPWGGGPCLHRVMVFTSALRLIARLNGAAVTARGWRHFSIARRCAWLEGLAGSAGAVAHWQRRFRRMKRAALAASLAIVLAAAFYEAQPAETAPSETDHPEHPAGPDDVGPRQPTWLVRLVDGDEVNGPALGPPQFYRDAHAPADLDDGRPARLGADAAAADNDVAVADARGHAVAVHAQGEGARPERLKARQLKVLDDSVRRGGG